MKQNPIADQDVIASVQEILQEGYLRESTILNLLPYAVYVCDAEGKIINYNRKAIELWGRTPTKENKAERFSGAHKIYYPDGKYIPPHESAAAASLKDGLPRENVEAIIERPDFSRKIITINTVAVKDEQGNIIGVIVCFYDITQQKEIQKELDWKTKELLDLERKNEELQKNEERYHRMIDEIQDYAIILLDKNGIVQNWNKGAENIKGYKENEIVGKSFKNFYLPEDRENGVPEKLLLEAKEKGKAIYEGWRMRKDGSRFWGNIVLTALHDDENNLIGFSKVTRDLTERKLAEDRLREHTNQLEFQNKELEQFAYAASHDMKEPLRKIQLYNSAIADNAANTLDEKSKEYLNRSITAAKRMAGLIEDLLAYSKTTVTTESFEQVNLNEVIEEIILMHKEEFEQRKVSIKMKSLPVICAIPFQIKQLMFNLINNSIKYKHPDRNVCVQIETEVVKGEKINEPGVEPFKNYQKISVIDNGVGFNQQYAEKVFNIFQRLNNSPSAKGSGIGLAICKRIVQNHHGFIMASGTEKKGARFDIYIPENL